MNERDMVNDVLAMVKSGAADYTRAIAETSHQELRQTLQQIRGQDEEFQFQLYKLAEQQRYYQPSPASEPQEIQQLREQLTNTPPQ